MMTANDNQRSATVDYVPYKQSLVDRQRDLVAPVAAGIRMQVQGLSDLELQIEHAAIANYVAAFPFEDIEAFFVLSFYQLEIARRQTRGTALPIFVCHSDDDSPIPF